MSTISRVVVDICILRPVANGGSGKASDAASAPQKNMVNSNAYQEFYFLHNETSNRTNMMNRCISCLCTKVLRPFGGDSNVCTCCWCSSLQLYAPVSNPINPSNGRCFNLAVSIDTITTMMCTYQPRSAQNWAAYECSCVFTMY
jgi:hypothetical protein